MVKKSRRDDLHNTKTQMKLFTVIATAVVLGGSLIAAATPASAYDTYRVTPKDRGGNRINPSNGYSGTYRNSNGGEYRNVPRHSTRGIYNFY